MSRPARIALFVSSWVNVVLRKVGLIMIMEYEGDPPDAKYKRTRIMRESKFRLGSKDRPK